MAWQSLSCTMLHEGSGDVLLMPQVAVEHNAHAYTFSTLLPKRWSDFLKKGSKDDVSKLSVRPGSRTKLPFANQQI